MPREWLVPMVNRAKTYWCFWLRSDKTYSMVSYILRVRKDYSTPSLFFFKPIQLLVLLWLKFSPVLFIRGKDVESGVSDLPDSSCANCSTSWSSLLKISFFWCSYRLSNWQISSRTFLFGCDREHISEPVGQACFLQQTFWFSSIFRSRISDWFVRYSVYYTERIRLKSICFRCVFVFHVHLEECLRCKLDVYQVRHRNSRNFIRGKSWDRFKIEKKEKKEKKL